MSNNGVYGGVVRVTCPKCGTTYADTTHGGSRSCISCGYKFGDDIIKMHFPPSSKRYTPLYKEEEEEEEYEEEKTVESILDNMACDYRHSFREVAELLDLRQELHEEEIAALNDKITKLAERVSDLEGRDAIF